MSASSAIGVRKMGLRRLPPTISTRGYNPYAYTLGGSVHERPRLVTGAGSVLVRRARSSGHIVRPNRNTTQSIEAQTVLRRARCRHLALEAEVDHAPSGEPENLGQPPRELPDPVE
jgi:hypothetical protein